MIIDTQYLARNKQLLVSMIDENGQLQIEHFHWPNPFKYEVCSPNDRNKVEDFKSWDGKPIKKVNNSFPDRYSTYEFLDALPKSDQERIFKFNMPNIFFIDIEVEVTNGFPEPSKAETMIQSISIVYDDKIIVLGLKELSEASQDKILKDTNKYFEKFGANYKFKYIKYRDEFDMLWNFFNNQLKKMPCITGWNFLNFDMRYLINRAKKLSKTVNGKKYTINPSVSSYTNKMNNIWGTEYEIPAHKLVFDYMELYESLDTSVKVKESSSLDFVSKNLLGLKKIEYDGSLMKLYEEDFEKFIFYNTVDSVLVQQIHLKMNYISIIFAISSLSKIKAIDVYSEMNKALGSLAITEGVLRGRFREQENIILFKNYARDNSDADSSIAGGWVKAPFVGMNRWVACYDFASLYPTTQRQFFIAPENYLGEIDSEDKSKYRNEVGNLMDIDLNVHVVCSNGTVFVKRMSPTINMLVDVYSDRKKYKKIMMAKKKEMDRLQKELDILKETV